MTLRLALERLRLRARRAATLQGHRLGSWRPMSDQDGHEAAYCRSCHAKAEIELARQPHMAGQAISLPCAKPDAFLANAHERDTTRGPR